MKHSKKAVKIMCTCAAAVFGLAGCGSNPLDPKDPVSLTIWHYYNGSQQSAFDALVEEFNDTVVRKKEFMWRDIVRGPSLTWRRR